MKPITIFLREVNSGQALRIDLPTCETDFCTRLRCDGTTFYIEKIRFDDMLRAEKLLMHSISFNELNYLALLYEALSDANKQLYKGVIESGCSRINGAKDLINLTQSLDCFYILQGVSTPALLCVFYISAAAHYKPKPILKKIKPEDYPQIGNILVRRQHGGFYNGNYYALRRGCTLKDFYSGDEKTIPKDARIFFIRQVLNKPLAEDSASAIFLKIQKEKGKNRIYPSTISYILTIGNENTWSRPCMRFLRRPPTPLLEGSAVFFICFPQLPPHTPFLAAPFPYPLAVIFR